MVRREDKNFDERYPRSESELDISPTLFIAAGEIKLSNIGNHEKNAKMGCICFVEAFLKPNIIRAGPLLFLFAYNSKGCNFHPKTLYLS